MFNGLLLFWHLGICIYLPEIQFFLYMKFSFRSVSNIRILSSESFTMGIKGLTSFLILSLTILCDREAQALQIPLGGNGFITQGPLGGYITDNGLVYWSSADTICSVYFKLTGEEKALQVGLRLQIDSGASKIEITMKGAGKLRKTKQLKIQSQGENYFVQNFTSFKTKAGYVKLDIKAISKNKTAQFFASISDVVIEGNTSAIDYVANKNNFLYGRRGPSVHFAFYPDTTNAPFEYFYSEITVPSALDPVSSFYMANGFEHGYFGMQRNDETTRKILFSVFGNFAEDNPDKIKPEDMVMNVKQGKGVTVQNFGNEGSGKQSFLIFPWKTDVTYKFLLRGMPDPTVANSSVFTAWFKAPETGWLLISSLRKPHLPANTYLSGFYNFLENFDPAGGYMTRNGTYGNQWVRTKPKDKPEAWEEILEGFFYADDTGKKNGRDDFAGGVTDDKKLFYLQNCGFFNKKVESDQYFQRLPSNDKPKINLNKLP